MDSEFWDRHFTQAHVAKELGVSRQNVQQRVKRGSIPSNRDPKGSPGIPKDWLFTTLALRSRGNKGEEVPNGE
jgi:hypothetical protein